MDEVSFLEDLSKEKTSAQEERMGCLDEFIELFHERKG